VDAAGNCYVFGLLQPHHHICPGAAGTSHLNALANDLFLAKYDRDGNFVWAKQAGGSTVNTGMGSPWMVWETAT